MIFSAGSSILALCAVLAAPAVAEEELRITLDTSYPADRLESAGVRVPAGRAIAARLGVASGSALELGGAWLASDRHAMVVSAGVAPGAASVAMCYAPEAVRARLQLLSRLIEEFGSPVVLVEAERPDSQDDRTAAAQLGQELAKCGLVSVDAVAARARSRARADEAVVETGLEAHAARESIDRPLVDFQLRVRRTRRALHDSEVYGMQLTSCEVALTTSLLRNGDLSSIPISPPSGSGRSRTASIAEAEAHRQALDGATLAIAEAIGAEWMAIAADERAWIIEVKSSRAVDLATLAGDAHADAGEITVLEHRPGMGALLSVPAVVARSIGSEPESGRVVHRSPGYIIIAAAPSQSVIAKTAWAVAACATVVLTAIVLAWRSRAKASPSI